MELFLAGIRSLNDEIRQILMVWTRNHSCSERPIVVNLGRGSRTAIGLFSARVTGL